MGTEMVAVYVTDESNIHEIEFERSYDVFAWLAGVRNYARIRPLSEPRGLPNDVEIVPDDTFDTYLTQARKLDPTKPIKLYSYRYCWVNSWSWYSLAELEAVDYDQEIESFRECEEALDNSCKSVSKRVKSVSNTQCSIMQEATYVVECVRFLGLLNGVVGLSSERTGYIAAEFEQDEGKNLTRLVRFYVTGDKTYVIDK